MTAGSGKSRPHDVIILGAGASGLVCGQRAAARGRDVLILDHGPKAARKVAVSGGGKCNFTNKRVSSADYAGENPQFCRSALARFTPEHLVSLFSNAGIAMEEREHGQLFCRRSAADAVRFLVNFCLESGCRINLGEKVLSLELLSDGKDGARFRVHTSQSSYLTHNVVIALGGPAWPQVGATDTGLQLAKDLGHPVTPIRPALAGLVMPPGWLLAGLEGISVPASIDLVPDGSQLTIGKKRFKTAENLALLFTHGGISGPAALQASLYWRKGLALEIDFLPSANLDALLDSPGAGKLLCKNFVRRLFPDRLAAALVPPEIAEKKCAELSRPMRDILKSFVHACRVSPARTEGFARAEVTAGGVRTDSVSSRSMESKRVPGIYFCGEVLDITGRLGGYNLHWAFASGHAAGESI